MAYFIRRYQKGVAQSGTQDVFVSESEIPISMFCEMAEMIGPGKYILGKRGEGIRGFKKITDTLVPEPNLRVFAAEDESKKDDSNSKDEDTKNDDTPEATPELAEKKEKATSPPPAPQSAERETISMRRTEKLSDMTDEQLSDLLGGMAQTPLNAETVATFQSDLSRVHGEMAERGMIAEPKAAEDRIVIGTGFSPWAAFGIGGAVGLAVGVLGSMHYYKKKMDDINVKLAEMDASIKEAESTIGKQERRIMKAEDEKKVSSQQVAQPVQRDPFDLDLQFLSSYNRSNGRLYE
jgi:Sec-independent protein translocase protein TatA